MQRVDLVVQLWDQLIEGSLEGLSTAFLGRFNCSDNCGKLRDLHDALVEVVLVFLLDLELEFGESVVDLAIEVDHVTDILEVFIDVVEVSSLLNVLLYIFDLL
jgi:hypothetical protein